MRGRSDSTADGVSVPIDPSDSTALRAIGAMIEPEVFLRVAEHALLLHGRAVLGHERELRRQLVEVDESRVEPLLVRELRGEIGLDLLVGDDAALRRVDEEDLPGLQAALAHDLGRVDVEHADLARHDHAVVVGDPVARRPQPVTVEDRADHGAVAERDRRGTVPRLHQRGVVAVERLAGRVHALVVLPRLRDHHEDRVVERATGEVEQLERLVEAGGVRRARRADREGALEVAGEQLARHHAFARAHPVLVALHGVDLTVVRQHPVRVRERPARERVRAEARVHERERALEARVAQVGVELAELVGGQHPLVDDDPRAERREVRVGLVLDPLAREVHVPLELVAREAVLGDEDLRERGHLLARRRARTVAVDGDRPPAEHREALVGEHLGDRVGGALDAVDGDERDPGRVRARVGELEVDGGPEVRVGHLHEDPGAVAGVGLRTCRAAVVQAAHGGERLLDDGMALAPLHVDDEADAARVVLESWVVERG